MEFCEKGPGRQIQGFISWNTLVIYKSSLNACNIYNHLFCFF